MGRVLVLGLPEIGLERGQLGSKGSMRDVVDFTLGSFIVLRGDSRIYLF
jgi:hypothetical protein